MDDAQIAAVVSETLKQDREGLSERIAVSVKATFDILGVNIEDETERRALKSGVQRLLRWDKSVGQIEKAGRVAAVTVVVTGFLGALWLGFMDKIKLH